MAGWHEYPPDHPRRLEDADPGTWDRGAAARGHGRLRHPRPGALPQRRRVRRQEPRCRWATTSCSSACIQAYNDFLTDWAARRPGPVHPGGVAAVLGPRRHPRRDRAHAPPWATRASSSRQDPSCFGLPKLTDRHWDPMWASAQEKGLPVNFHIASGALDLFDVGVPENGKHANYALMGVSFFMGNAKTIAQLICGGICHRFPELDFVSVESGVGWIPFALEALDWQWKNCGVAQEHPEYDLLPSEYFAPPDLRLLLVRARLVAGGDRPARRRQHPVRDRLPAPHEHVARARQRRPSAPTTTCATRSRTSTRRRCGRSSTTTPPASTTSTDRGRPDHR